MRERDIEKIFVDRIKMLGGEVRKLKWIGRKGAPDRIVFGPGGAVCFVELKAPGEKLSVSQKREHKRLQKLGVDVYKVDSVNEAYSVTNLVMRIFY